MTTDTMKWIAGIMLGIVILSGISAFVSEGSSESSNNAPSQEVMF